MDRAKTHQMNIRKFPNAGMRIFDHDFCLLFQLYRTSFLSRQPDVIASFLFGACTVQTCFQQSPDILRKSVHYDGFSTLFANNLL